MFVTNSNKTEKQNQTSKQPIQHLTTLIQINSSNLLDRPLPDFVAQIVMSTEHNNVDHPITVPSLTVRKCDADDSNNGNEEDEATAIIDKRMGTLAADFPKATVKVCYTDTTIQLNFTAYDEFSFYVNESYINNDPIYDYTVMEAFIATGIHDSTSYLEFEVAPNNVTWTGYIQNPNKNFTPSANAMITELDVYPITAVTTTNPIDHTWTSLVEIPLSMFNVPTSPEGTQWRMNFFRTYYADDDTTAQQEFGAWNPNELISFHQTPYFGMVEFVSPTNSQPHNNLLTGNGGMR